MRNKQNGFGVIEGLLLLVIVGLIALAGWYVYKANQATPGPSDSSQITQTENTPEVNNADDLEKAEDFVESKDVDSQLDTSEIDSSLSQ